MKPDWQDLVTTSHLSTVDAIRKLLEEKEYEQAQEGIEELYDAMAKVEQRALIGQLKRLMLHILKWRYQPDKRSTSWVRSIVDARQEIAEIQEFTPSLNRQFVEANWERAFAQAVAGAKAEMNLSRKDRFEPAELTWQEVFDDEYLL